MKSPFSSPSFAPLALTEAKPPLFSSDSVPKNSIFLSSLILKRPTERPPITPSLTVCHGLAASGLSNSNRIRSSSLAISGEHVNRSANKMMILYFMM